MGTCGRADFGAKCRMYGQEVPAPFSREGKKKLDKFRLSGNGEERLCPTVELCQNCTSVTRGETETDGERIRDYVSN